MNDDIKEYLKQNINQIEKIEVTPTYYGQKGYFLNIGLTTYANPDAKIWKIKNNKIFFIQVDEEQICSETNKKITDFIKSLIRDLRIETIFKDE